MVILFSSRTIDLLTFDPMSMMPVLSKVLRTDGSGKSGDFSKGVISSS